VLASIVGDSFSDILRQQQVLPTVHKNAVTWIMQNGRQKTIHFYIVDKGVVNTAPLLFDTFMQANNHLATCYPFDATIR
jgi:hypothetical protein